MGAGPGDFFSPMGIAQTLLQLLGGQQQQQAYNKALNYNLQSKEDILGLIDKLRGRTEGQLFEGQRGIADTLRGGNQAALDASQKLTDTMTGGYGQRATGAMDLFGTGAQGIQQGYGSRVGDLRSGWEGTSRDVRSQLEDRLKRNMAYLEGAGEQERKDITQRNVNERADAQQSAVSRGLTGSTIAPSIERGSERRLNDSLGGLEERLRQQRLATDAALSGDVADTTSRMGMFGSNLGERLSGDALNANQQLLGAGTNLFTGLTGDTLNAMNQGGQRDIGIMGAGNDQLAAMMERLLNQRIGYDTDLTNMQTGVMERVSYPYPDASGNMYLNMANQFGNTMANKQAAGNYPQPSFWSSFIPGAGAAAGTAAGTAGLAGLGSLFGGGGGGAIMGKIFFGCISGDAEIETPDGGKPLKDIVAGDIVLDHQGYTRVVKHVDYGIPHPDRMHDYLRITVRSGPDIVLTKDHVIGDKPAGDWMIGERIPLGGGASDIIASIETVEPVPSGDLLLEGGHDYYANGFPVGSMMTRYGLTNWALEVEACRSK